MSKNKKQEQKARTKMMTGQRTRNTALSAAIKFGKIGRADHANNTGIAWYRVYIEFYSKESGGL